MKAANPINFIQILPFLIVITIIIGVSFFIFFHIRDQNRFMKEKGFRTLENISLAFSDKIKYERNKINTDTALFLNESELSKTLLKDFSEVGDDQEYLLTSVDFLDQVYRYQDQIGGDIIEKVELAEERLDTLQDDLFQLQDSDTYSDCLDMLLSLNKKELEGHQWNDCFNEEIAANITGYIKGIDEIFALLKAKSESSDTNVKHKDATLTLIEKTSIQGINNLLNTRTRFPALIFESAGHCDLHYIIDSITDGTYNSKTIPFEEFKGKIFNNDFFDNLFLFDDKKIYFNGTSNYTVDEVDSTLSNSIAAGINQRILNFPFSGSFHDLYIKKIDGLSQDIYIGGLISKTSYNRKVQQIDPFLVGLILLLLVLVLLLFPIWKLLFMNQYDDLNRSDVYLNGLSLVAGAFYFVTLLLSIYTHFNSSRLDLRHSLEHLSQDLHNDISDLFTNAQDHLNELRNAYEDRINLNSRPRTRSHLNSVNDSLMFDAFKEEYLFNYEAALFLRKSGELKSVNTHLKTPPIRLKLSNRSYFKDPIENRNNYFSTDSIGQKFYFQSIYAYTTKINEFAFSTPIADAEQKEIKVIALISRLDKFIDPIMPLGYSYALIEPSGKVLLHSNKDKILRENYIVECDDNAKLNDAISNRIEENLKVYYNGAEHLVRVLPFDGMPYFLVTMYDLRVHQRINTRINVYMVSLLSSNVFLIILLTLVSLLVFYKKFKYADTKFVHTWLLYVPMNQNKYLFLAASYLMLSIVYLFSVIFTKNLLLAISTSWIIVVGANISNFTVLNGIDKLKIKMSFKGHIETLKPIQIILFYLINLLFIAFIIYLFFAGGQGSGLQLRDYLFFVIMTISVVAIPITYYYRLGIASKIGILKRIWEGISSKLELHKQNPHYLFPAFFTLWIIIVSVVPGVHYFKSIYIKEQNLWKYYEFKESTRLIEEKLKYLAEFQERYYKPYSANPLDSMLISGGKFLEINDSKHPVLGNYLGDQIQLVFKKNVVTTDSTTDQSDFNLLNLIYKKLRIVLPIVVEENQIHTLLSDRKSLLEDKINSASQNLNLWGDYVDLTVSSEIKSSSLLPFNQIYAFSQSEQRINWMATLIIWLVKTLSIIGIIALFLRGLWLITTYVLKNTAFYQFDSVLHQNLDNKSGFPIHKELNATFPDKIYKPVYVFTLNKDKSTFSKDIQSLIDKVRRAESKEFKIINCTDLSNIDIEKGTLKINNHQLIDKKCNKILIANLDYNIKNIENFKARIKIFEWLYQFNHIDIVVTSSSGLFRFKELYQELLRQYTNDVKQIAELENTWNKWVFLLRKFKREIIPMRLIRYLKNIETDIIGDFDEDTTCDDEKNVIYFAYQSIWSSLSQKEKILLLDLAEDGIINIKNNQALNVLVKKGLISYRLNNSKKSYHEDPNIKITRNSFKSFVLQLKDSGETKEIRKWISNKGNWANTKYIILILIVGLLIFIGFLEKSFFDRFIALFGASAAVIPLIFRLSQNLLFKKDVDI